MVSIALLVDKNLISLEEFAVRHLIAPCTWVVCTTTYVDRVAWLCHIYSLLQVVVRIFP